MKKALSFAVALGLVAGMGSSAVASDMLEFHGTSRVRGIRGDFTQPSTAVAGDEVAQYNMRTRFDIKANVTEGVSVNARMQMANYFLGDGGAAAGFQTTEELVDVDYSYIAVSALGGSWSMGRMPASWTPFFSWGGNQDRIKAMYKVGNGTLGGFIQKSTERNLPDNSGDSDAYSLLYLGSAGDVKYKVIGIVTDDDLTGNGGLMIDANVAGKAGEIGWEAEVAYKDNDAWTDAQTGIMANMTMGLGDGMALIVDAAYSMDGFTADDDYNPTNLIGNSVTAVTQFGADATFGEDAILVAAGVNFKLDDASSIEGKLGYYTSDDLGGADQKAIGADVTYVRSLAKNTNFILKGAYADMESMANVLNDDDAVWALGWEVQTKW